jgi:hypothetical protein
MHMTLGILDLMDFPQLEDLHVRNWDFSFPEEFCLPMRACIEMPSAPKLKRLIWDFGSTLDMRRTGYDWPDVELGVIHDFREDHIEWLRSTLAMAHTLGLAIRDVELRPHTKVLRVKLRLQLDKLCRDMARLGITVSYTESDGTNNQ